MRIGEWRNIIFCAIIVFGFALFAAGSAMGQQRPQAPNATQATPSTTLSDEQKVESEKIVKDANNMAVDIAKWTLPIVAALFSVVTVLFLGILASTFFTQRTAVRDAAKTAVEGKQKDMEEKLENHLKDLKKTAQREFNNLVDFQQTQYQLFRQLEDITEPSIRHRISKSAESLIKSYLTKLDNIKSKGGIGEIKLTSFDHETTGDAYHYLAGVPDLKEREELEDKAIQNYKEALMKMYPNSRNPEMEKADANNYGIKRKLGNAYAGMCQYYLAIDQYEQIANTKADPAAYLSWGDALQQMKPPQYDEAVKKYDEAIKLSKDNSPSYLESHYEKGNVLVAQGKYNDAIKSHKAIIEKTNREWANFGLADTYRKKGQYEESIKYYMEEEKSYPGKGETFFRIGQAWAGLNDYQKANEYYEKAVNSESAYKLPPLWAYWGYALKQLAKTEQDRQEANNYLQESIETAEKNQSNNSKDCSANYELALCYAMRGDEGDKEKALEKLVQAIDINPYAWIWAQTANCSDFKEISDSEEFKKLRPSRFQQPENL